MLLEIWTGGSTGDKAVSVDCGNLLEENMIGGSGQPYASCLDYASGVGPFEVFEMFFDDKYTRCPQTLPPFLDLQRS